MNAAAAFLLALGSVYIGFHIEGKCSSMRSSQAPVIALRKRVRELESAVNGNASDDNA
jgi:hypothetical protein